MSGSPTPTKKEPQIGSPGWVRFEEDEGANGDTPTKDKSANATNGTLEQAEQSSQYSGAIIQPETAHVSLDRSLSRAATAPATGITSPSKADVAISIPSPQQPLHVPATPTSTAPDLRTIDLGGTHAANGALHGGVSSISGATVISRQGFVNGDIIVTLLPVNTRWPWITPAKFRPELVPEELMAQGLTLTVEDYVHVMELLTNDVRFTLYNVCYKRVLALWVLLAFTVLLILLFSGVTGLTLFGLGVLWLIINAAAIVICMWVKIKLNHNLERCMATVNRHLLRHKILLGLDDRGKLSCHKVNLCFIYFDTAECVKKLQEVIDSEERVGRVVGREETAEERRQRQQLQQRMDIDDSDIIIQGASTTRLSRKQGRAEMLMLRYSQRWAKLYLRKLLPLMAPLPASTPPSSSSGLSAIPPRHCQQGRCPCHFIEEHLRYKPSGKLTLHKFFSLPNFGFK